MNKTYNGHVNVKHRICIYHTACITVRVALQRVKVNFFIANLRHTTPLCGCDSEQLLAHAKLLPRELNDDDADDINDDCDVDNDELSER